MHGLELTEEHFADDLMTLSKVEELTLHVTFAKKQRHLNLAKDLSHDWSRISASNNPVSSTNDRSKTKSALERNLKVYDDDPF